MDATPAATKSASSAFFVDVSAFVTSSLKEHFQCVDRLVVLVCLFGRFLQIRAVPSNQDNLCKIPSQSNRSRPPDALARTCYNRYGFCHCRLPSLGFRP